MSDLSLYKLCLQKVPIYLKDGIYKPCHENPFSSMPSNIVNDLMSATIDILRKTGLKADYLELLLTSGRLRELQILEEDVDQDYACQLVSQVLHIFKSHCQELEILHLTTIPDCAEWESDMSEAIENVLKNSPNLKELVSFSSFDLKALRICKKLRSVKLQFERQQPWYDFLAKEGDHLQPHKYLEIFTFDSMFVLDAISCADVAIILRHCPELTSLGEIDSLQVLSVLHKMGFPPSELKLRYCYWLDLSWYHRESLYLVNYGAIEDAVKYYPLMKELYLDAWSIDTFWLLRNLRNLVYLNITSRCRENIGAVFRYALQEIGSRLKHLSYDSHCPVDISILLQYCPNLESLKISVGYGSISVGSVVHLPRLQRFCFSGSDENLDRIFSQFSGCNQLTDLFILTKENSLDDETLYRFLKRNSLLNLKAAFLKCVRLTEHGFREFLLKAPQLEKVEIDDDVLRIRHSETDPWHRVMLEINHKAICNKNSISENDEFFKKISLENSPSCVDEYNYRVLIF